MYGLLLIVPNQRATTGAKPLSLSLSPSHTCKHSISKLLALFANPQLKVLQDRQQPHKSGRNKGPHTQCHSNHANQCTLTETKNLSPKQYSHWGTENNITYRIHYPNLFCTTDTHKTVPYCPLHAQQVLGLTSFREYSWQHMT